MNSNNSFDNSQLKDPTEALLNKYRKDYLNSSNKQIEENRPFLKQEDFIQKQIAFISGSTQKGKQGNSQSFLHKQIAQKKLDDDPFIQVTLDEDYNPIERSEKPQKKIKVDDFKQTDKNTKQFENSEKEHFLKMQKAEQDKMKELMQLQDFSQKIENNFKKFIPRQIKNKLQKKQEDKETQQSQNILPKYQNSDLQNKESDILSKNKHQQQVEPTSNVIKDDRQQKQQNQSIKNINNLFSAYDSDSD